MRVVHSILSAAVVAALLAPAAEAKNFISAPLSICDQGSFFSGGVPKTTFYATSRANPAANANAVQITIGQVYVSFQRPNNAFGVKKWPVVLWHGSTHSGACVESTPHGTEGWRDWTLRKGLSTYVIDQAGRGRSGNDESIVAEQAHDQVGNATALNYYGAPGRITDNGSWTAWFGHLVLPGTATTTGNITGFSGPNALPPNAPVTTAGELQPHGWRCGDNSNVNIHPNACTPAGMYPPAYALDGPAAVTTPEYPNSTAPGDTLVWLGPSGQGPLPTNTPDHFHLNYYKQLLPNYETTLPTSHCGACGTTPAGANIGAADTWSPFGVALLVEKINGSIVGTHSQSGSQGHNMTRILKERGHLGLLKALVTIEGSCSLPGAGLLASDFDHIPYLAFKGDYTVHSGLGTGCEGTVASINASVTHDPLVKAEYVELDAPSYGTTFNGVTHMMMDGTNNIAVMDEILKWTGTYVKNPIVASCSTN